MENTNNTRFGADNTQDGGSIVLPPENALIWGEESVEPDYEPQDAFEYRILAEIGAIDAPEGMQVVPYDIDAAVAEDEKGDEVEEEEADNDFEEDMEAEEVGFPKRHGKVQHGRGNPGMRNPGMRKRRMKHHAPSAPFLSTDALEETRQDLYARYPDYEARALIDEVLRHVYRQLAAGPGHG